MFDGEKNNIEVYMNEENEKIWKTVLFLHDENTYCTNIYCIININKPAQQDLNDHRYMHL